MQIPLSIAMRRMPRSDALEGRIRSRVDKLEEFHPRITGCHVAVEEIDRHRHQGRQFSVKVEVTAPGRAQAVSTLHHHEDVYVAVRDAFDAVARQLEELVREKRGDVKLHEPVARGTGEAAEE